MFVSGWIAIAHIFRKCYFEECYRCDKFILMYYSLVETHKDYASSLRGLLAWLVTLSTETVFCVYVFNNLCDTNPYDFPVFYA
jgi:hypothetical protein